MKLIFVTQVYDASDGVLGFVTRWVEGFAKHCERVCVLALEVGDVSARPANVDVFEIGRRGKVGRYFRYRKFLQQHLGREGFDCVLAHMVPRYATLAEGIARKNGRGNFLWYTHKGVDGRLLKAIQKVDKVFTASHESLRVETPKKVITGHGIDLQHFDLTRSDSSGEAPRLLSVGRLTPAKDPLTALRALALLHKRGLPATLEWVGAGLVENDQGFTQSILVEAEALGIAESVVWPGMVSYQDIPSRYHASDILVSTSQTGSVDKVVLEAMAARLPTIVSGEAYPPLWAELGESIDSLTFPVGNAEALADKVQAMWSRTGAERLELGERLRQIVEQDHEVDALMARLVDQMRSPA